jgi:hypothetical protein
MADLIPGKAGDHGRSASHPLLGIGIAARMPCIRPIEILGGAIVVRPASLPSAIGESGIPSELPACRHVMRLADPRNSPGGPFRIPARTHLVSRPIRPDGGVFRLQGVRIDAVDLADAVAPNGLAAASRAGFNIAAGLMDVANRDGAVVAMKCWCPVSHRVILFRSSDAHSCLRVASHTSSAARANPKAAPTSPPARRVPGRSVRIVLASRS